MAAALTEISSELRASTEQSLALIIGQPGISQALRADASHEAALARVVACSPFAADVMARYPQLLAGPRCRVEGFEVVVISKKAPYDFERYLLPIYLALAGFRLRQTRANVPPSDRK